MKGNQSSYALWRRFEKNYVRNDELMGSMRFDGASGGLQIRFARDVLTESDYAEEVPDNSINLGCLGPMRGALQSLTSSCLGHSPTHSVLDPTACSLFKILHARIPLQSYQQSCLSPTVRSSGPSCLPQLYFRTLMCQHVISHCIRKTENFFERENSRFVAERPLSLAPFPAHPFAFYSDLEQVQASHSSLHVLTL